MSSQRHVLITGANRGIGFETARQLAKRGFHVFVSARNEQAGEGAAQKIRQEGGAAEFLELDVASSQSIADAAKELARRTNHLDVLINNAGVYLDEKAAVNILNVPRRLLEETFATNTFGPIEVTAAFVPLLEKAKEPRVIHVSSGYGQLEGLYGGAPSYCLSKLALSGVTIMQAQVLRSKNIAVNCVCPGWVRTDMGGPNATYSVEEGADTIVWLADEEPHVVFGKFFRDRREIPW